MRTRSLRKKASRFSQAGPRPQSSCDAPHCVIPTLHGCCRKTADVTPFIAYCLETEIKYEGYIKRQQSQIGAVKRQEETPIPEDFDYAPLAGLRLEAREKLAKIRPRSVGQAARIPGVGPADVACLAVELAKRRRSEGKE